MIEQLSTTAPSATRAGCQSSSSSLKNQRLYEIAEIDVAGGAVNVHWAVAFGLVFATSSTSRACSPAYRPFSPQPIPVSSFSGAVSATVQLLFTFASAAAQATTSYEPACAVVPPVVTRAKRTTAVHAGNLIR